MLHEFLRTNRSELIERCRDKASARRAPLSTPAELAHGVPLFLDQLTEVLAQAEEGSARPTPPDFVAMATESGLARGATRHGGELQHHAFTIDQVVHDYGDLCQSITELAAEQAVPITVQEFGILNIRLDNAIAVAVTEFAREKDMVRSGADALAAKEHLGTLAHEMRNHLNTMILALTAIRMGSVGFGGATAGALDRSLIGMRTLIDRALAEVRLEGGAQPFLETIDIGAFVAELSVAAALEASQKLCTLNVIPVPRGMRVQADRHILASAVSNLLQNAFKFTHHGTTVTLRARPAGARVLIEVEDECGGLAKGMEQQIFRPFQQRGADRSGVGLGLSLSRRAVESFGGALSVSDLPGRGCVFTIDLPAKA
jgi:signal transduction histidine kinase